MDATLERVEELVVIDGDLVFLNENGEVLETTDAHTLLMGGGSSGDPVDDAPWPDSTPWYSRD